MKVVVHFYSLLKSCFAAMTGLLLVFTFSISQAHTSQLDSVVSLKEFLIEANRFTQNNVGYKSEKLDSSSGKRMFALNLSDALVQNNSFFVKSYGLGSLSTGSLRGSTASQTATLWNGFNLQSPMNGVIDYALVPSILMDEINLNYGGSTSLFGSGSIGGTLLLTNKAEFNKGMKAFVNASFASFDDYQQALKISWSNAKFNIVARAFHHTSANNFPFINTAEINRPLQYQQNAKLNQNGLLLENYIHLTSRQELSIRYWYQLSDRQIPAAMVSSVSKQNQLDEFHRANIEWAFTSNKNQVKVRAAYFDELLKFNDPDIQLFSISRSKTLIAEAEESYFFTPHLYLNVGLNNTNISATSDGYGFSQPNQNRTSAFAALQSTTQNATWKNKLSFRKEFYGSNQAPITASFGSEKTILKAVKVRGNISRNYRLPTFNDLFWTEQGAKGSPDLKPESGWSADAGIGIHHKKNKWTLESEAAVFNNEVKNMIVWQPAANAIWSPHNINSVWSRGLEFSLKFSYKVSQVLFQLNGNYTHTLSTNNKKDNAPNSLYKKQLFYVPNDCYQAQVSAIYKGIQLSYLHNYTGKRFTNNENSEYLKSFQVGAIQLSKEVSLKKIRIGINAQVQNVWNEQYQVIAWRPMPGINYTAGVSISFN
jgi:vitamin B12 transporter